MKTSILSLMTLLVMVVASSFSTADLSFSIKFEGSEHRDIMKEGLTGPQMTQMMITANQEGVAVEEFEIILARGQSPLYRETVTGSTTALKKYRGIAKPGDRIVVQIKSVSGTDVVLSDENSILQVRIK